MEELIQQVINYLGSLSHEVSLLILSALPLSELRGAIPVGILYFEMNPIKTYVICCLGNMIPIIPILLFFDRVEAILKKSKVSNKLLQWYIDRTKKRAGIIEKYELWGLILFVAIPLPVTGAWTGSVAAFLLGIRFRKALLSIFLGVLIAGIIVTLLTLGGHKVYTFL